MEHQRNIGLILLMVMDEDVISLHSHFQRGISEFSIFAGNPKGYFHFYQFITNIYKSLSKVI